MLILQRSSDAKSLYANTKAGRALFRRSVRAFYLKNRRSFAWRQTTDPYHIIVSEIMLQQTQTERVKAKFEYFIERFPSLEALAQASTAQVIATWQGLGYNRRALSLHLLAQTVMSDYAGVIPQEPSQLIQFKGIGPATASSICAFAFNRPTLFVETNIRAVFIHCFFTYEPVEDRQIMPILEATLDREDPRNWYYALMDLGVMLKKLHHNPSRRSAHYAVQSRFEGSDRQVRGQILKLLIDIPSLTEDFFFSALHRDQDVIKRILKNLESEGFICESASGYSLVSS